jgi:hypothetical protein
LAFEWDEVVPLRDSRCAECGYQLHGLTEPRCPECGTPFSWDDVLAAARSRQNRLIEHWRRHPIIRTLLRTWWLAAFRPRKLWAQFSVHDPPKVGPLMVFVLLQWLVFAFGWRAMASVVDPAMNGLARWQFSRQAQAQPTNPASAGESLAAGTDGPLDADPQVEAEATLDGAEANPSSDDPATIDLAGRRQFRGASRRPQRFVYRWRVRRDYLPFAAIWYLGAFGSFQLFIATKRRFRMRWQQILRVFAHATAFASLCTALWCLLEALVDCTWFFITPPPGVMNEVYLRLWQGMFVLGVGMTWLCLWTGFRCYLKIPYGWAAAPACLLLGYKSAALIMIFWPGWLWPWW